MSSVLSDLHEMIREQQQAQRALDIGAEHMAPVEVRKALAYAAQLARHVASSVLRRRSSRSRRPSRRPIRYRLAVDHGAVRDRQRCSTCTRHRSRCASRRAGQTRARRRGRPPRMGSLRDTGARKIGAFQHPGRADDGGVLGQRCRGMAYPHKGHEGSTRRVVACEEVYLYRGRVGKNEHRYRCQYVERRPHAL
jgi:hypothetical protein